MKKNLVNLITITLIVLVSASSAFAEGSGDASAWRPLGAGLAMGLAALGAALGQGKALGSGLDSIGRNPSARGDIFTPMLVGLAFIEAVAILSFVIALGLSN
jgi:F-type H+-transporting ATPase subunit c